MRISPDVSTYTLSTTSVNENFQDVDWCEATAFTLVTPVAYHTSHLTLSLSLSTFYTPANCDCSLEPLGAALSK